MSNSDILGVIQVRMASQRLPGKALRVLGDKSLLAWVVQRSRLSERVGRWIVATSDDSSSDPIVDLCRELGVEVFRGDETDVLSRFAACVKLYQPKYVVRVCADNPFVWGPLVDDLIDQLVDGDIYLANHQTHNFCSIADGFGAEIIEAQRLVEAHKSSKSPMEREHVTLQISHHHSSRKVVVCPELRHPYMRFDVDTAEDFETLQQLILTCKILPDSCPAEIVARTLGIEFQALLAELFPMHRSLAGAMNRKTLEVLEGLVPLRRRRVRTGARVFDWTVPPEWSLTKGYIANRHGKRMVDIEDNQLHVVSYSSPLNRVVELSEIRGHLHVHASLEAIPYRTAYYHRDWGFAVMPSQWRQMEADGGPFTVVIESEFTDGFLDFADLVKTGSSPREILISTYFCHPNLANDSLSGVVLTALLARYLMAQRDLRYTYRIAFVPETIGALVLLDSLGTDFDQIFCGLQVTTVGGPGSYQIKQSWNPQHPINAIASKVLNMSGREYQELVFDIHGSDERQYSSPGFRINMLTIARNIYYSYPEYHSSLDNLDLVNGQQISDTFSLYVRLINELESRRVFVRVEPRGEPMLSRHKLYDVIGGSLTPDSAMSQLDLALWVLFLCDGDFSTEDIACRVGMAHEEVLMMCDQLSRLDLLREA